MMSDAIPVGDLVRCSVCPLQVYLSRSSPEEFAEPVGYSIAKQVAAHLGEPLDPAGIWEELQTVLPDAGPQERERLFEMADTCSRTVWRSALCTDVFVSSAKYGITGRVDRLFEDGFSIVKSSAAPSSGIYAADRLRLTAYALCLEEEHEKPYAGSVEYLGSGTVRYLAAPSPADRRAFLAALRRAESVFRGEVPRPVHGRHCLSCRHHERCSEASRPKSLFERLYPSR